MPDLLLLANLFSRHNPYVLTFQPVRMEGSNIIDNNHYEVKVEEARPSLAKRRSITFKNDAVLITEACEPSTPIYAALSFLLKQEEKFARDGTSGRDLELEVEDCLVMIYTAVEKEYGAFWEEDPECTKIQFDEWLLQNGIKGKYARLFQRIQIVEIETLEQLSMSLALFPSSTQNQQVPKGPMMIIIHDMTMVEKERSPFQTSLDPLVQTYLMIISEALECIRLAGDGGSVLFFDSFLDPPVVAMLSRYLEQESIAVDVEGNDKSTARSQSPKKGEFSVKSASLPSC